MNVQTQRDAHTRTFFCDIQPKPRRNIQMTSEKVKRFFVLEKPQKGHTSLADGSERHEWIFHKIFARTCFIARNTVSFFFKDLLVDFTTFLWSGQTLSTFALPINLSEWLKCSLELLLDVLLWLERINYREVAGETTNSTWDEIRFQEH